MAEIKKINTELQPIDKLLDTSGDAGTSGQILSTTGSGTNWIDDTGGSVTGTGTDEQVTYWTSATVIDGDDGFKYNKGASNNSIITLTSTGLQALSFVDSNSAYADAMSILRDSDKLSLTYGHNANEEAITIVGGTGSDLGYVGIKETSPQNTLHVQGTFRVGPWYATSDRDHFLVTPGGSVTTVSTPNENVNYDNSAGSTHIRTNSGYNTPVERLTVLSGGNVGIGVIDPDSRLEIKGAGGTTGLTLKTTDSLGNTGFWTQDGGATGVHFYPFVVGMDHDDAKPSSTLFYARPSVGTDVGLFVKTDGDVGIGTLTPTRKLHVSSADNQLARFESTDAYGGIEICDNTSGTAKPLISALGNAFIFYNGGGSHTEALRIDSSQNATFAGNIDVQGNSATIGSSSQTTTTLNLTATNTAGSPANAIEVIMTGYEGRGIGTFYKDTTYSGAEWFNGIIYSGSFANYAIGYDATGGQAEYAANSLLTIYKTGDATFAGTAQATTYLVNRTTAAGYNPGDAGIADENSAELGAGYLTLSRSGTAQAYQIVFGKNGDEHSSISTSSTGMIIAADRFTVNTDIYTNTLTINSSFYIANNTLSHSAGDITLDAGGDIILDADGADIRFKDAGTEFGRINNNSSGNFLFLSPISDKDIIFKGNDGGSEFVALTLDMSEVGYATFAGKVRANNWFQGADGTNTLYATSSTGVLIETPGSTASNNDSKIFFRNSGNIVKHTFDTNSGDAVFVGKATSATTITGDGTQTLTTKNYVDGLIVGATIYQGTWDARTSAEGGSGAGGSPDLTTSTYKTNGYYLVVSNEGTATPNGPSTTPALWHVGDWVIYNDHTGSGAWQKIDNSSVLSGTGTGQKVIKWAGSGTSDTIADGPITFSTNDSTFAGAGTFGGILKVSYSNPAFDLQESGTSRFRLELGASHTYLSALGAYNMYFRTNSGAALTIYADQDAEFHNKVGIGITPAEMLDIQSASGDARIRLDAPASSDTEIKFYNAGVAQYTIGHDDATDNFVIGGANVDAPLVSIAKDGDATFTGNISVPAGSKVLFDGSSGHTYIEEESDTNLKFYVAAGERLNLTNSYATFTVPVRTGSITTPTNTSLFLIPNGSGHVYLGDSGNGTNLYHYSTADDGKYTTYDFNGDYYRIATTATSGIKIDDTLTVTGVSTLANVGYLGDGLGSVQYTLQSSNTGYGTIDFGDVADSNIGRLEYNHNDNSFLIRTNNTTALTLDSSQDATFAGNILGSATDFKIGANTSDASDNAQLKIMGGGDATDTRGASIHLAGNEHANAGLLQIRAGDGATGGIRFYEGGSERMRITAGNVGIGIAAPNFRLGLSNSAASTPVYQQFTNGTTGVASGDGTVMGIDADGDFLINNQEAKEIKFYTSDAGPRLTIQADGDAVFAKDVLIPRYLYHDGDSNTYLDFQTDRITLVAGSIEFVDCSESTQNVLTLGASSDMDVNMRGGDGYVFIQGSNGYIGINDITPSYPLDINANTYITGTLKTTGPITINNWLQQGSGSLQKRTYSFTTADPGGQFFLGKIEDSDTDGAIDGTITFAYDYGSTNDQCKLHFNFVQRDGAARGTWWYEGDDQDIAADRVHVQLIDDGSGGMFVWVIAVDYSKCIVDTSWMDGNSVVDSGVLSDGTPTTGTVLFDTADDPTAEMHVGTLFAHGNVEASGTIACPAYFNATGTSAVLGATGSGQVLLRPNGIGSSSGQLKIATSGDATFASGATFGGDVTINGTLTEEGSGSNKTYTWRTPSSTSWSGGVKNVKFGRIYWCPNHWTNGAVINIILQGSYYAGVERKYTVTAQYLDTDPIIQQLSVADTDNKIALKVGATTSAGYDYSGQPVYYADLNFVCNSYMVGWCIVKSQMPFLTANPTSTWGGIVMDATLTEPDTSATFPDSYNTTFAGDVTAQGGTFTQAGGGVQILNNGTAGYNANLFFGKSGGTDGYSIGQGVTANDGVFRIYNNGTASVALAIDNSDNATFAGLLYGPDGSKAAPTYSFTSDTNTGMHSDAADQLSLIAGGNTTLEITGSTIALNATTTLTSANLILSTNANIELETSIGSGKSSGTIIKIGSGTLVAGKCYAMYNNAGPAWSETDPTDENFSKQLLGIALGSGASAATTEGMLTNGIFYDAAHSFTVGEPLFLSTTTGTLSNTAPTTSGDLVRVVGYAIDTDEIYFCPDNTWVILD